MGKKTKIYLWSIPPRKVGGGKKALRREARTAAAKERDALVREKEREERAKRSRLADEAADRTDRLLMVGQPRDRGNLRHALALALALLPLE